MHDFVRWFMFKSKVTFEVIVKRIWEGGDDDYPTIEAKEARTVVSTAIPEKFDPIFAGGLIHTVLQFLEENGVDALQSLCEAIESVGQVNDENGQATVFMGELFDVAQKIRYPKST